MPSATLRSALIAAFCALFLIPGIAGAQPTLTESDVVDAVRAGNLALQAARTGAEAAAERPGQVRPADPMVEVMPMPRMLLDGEPGLQVMGRQPITWRDRLRADREARGLMADATALEADAFEREQVLMARMIYAELWALQEMAARIDTFITQLDLFHESALSQYRTGRGPQQAVLGIGVEAEMRAQRLEVLREEEAGLAAQLAVLTGGRIAVSREDRLAPPSTSAPSDAAAFQAAIAVHPMVEAGRAMQDSEEAMARMARTMLRPDLTVGVNLNLSRMAFQRMYGQEVAMPSVGVMIPLRRESIRAEIREAEYRAGQRELETAHTRLALESELADVLAQLERVRTRIDRYENRLRPQVRQTLEATIVGYQAGLMRFLELLDIQRMALEVETDLIMARMQEAILIARLDAVIGRTP
jgi:outer membrane protein, heavy metal efflux system